jgi:TRAP transporter TAXI family solute receptor
MAQTFSRLTLRDGLILVLCLLAIVGGLLWLAFYKLRPAPPSQIVMTTGGASGAYHAFGKRYQEILRQSGVRLDLETSAGAMDNLARLTVPDTKFAIGLLQGGTANATAKSELVSLGRMFYEAVWVLYTSAKPLDRLSELSGKRIAIGAEGSGTRVLAEALLAESAVTTANARLLPFAGENAVKALRTGEVDAAILVFSPEAPLIQSILREGDLRLMSLTHADAYARRLPYLSKVVLPQGVVDLQRNIPGSDVALLATTGVLAARADLHPALIYLLAQAAAQVHGKPGLLHAAGDFPKVVDPELEMAEGAVRFYKNGAPFLQRYMSFWLANLVERALILAVPLATMLIPIVKGVPLLYRWRVRSRLLQWYARMKRLEASLEARPTPGQVRTLQDELERIEDEVNDSPVPIGFSEQFYNLREHIDFVRRRLTGRVGVTPAR